MSALVSVVVPAFNAAPFIARAIESAKAENPYEIIIVDDGSKDETAGIARSSGARVIQTTNGGPGRARNLGIASAKGEWIALLDADDFWFSGKLKVQLPEIRADIGIISTRSDCPAHRFLPDISLSDLWERNYVVASSVLLRRAAWEQAGGFSEKPSLIGVEDYHLWLRVAEMGWRIRCVPAVLTHYTVGIGLSSDWRKQMNGLLALLDDLEGTLSLPTAQFQKKRLQILCRCTKQALRQHKLGTVLTTLSRALHVETVALRRVV